MGSFSCPLTVLDLGALIRNLEPLARRNGHQSGEAFTADLEIMACLDIKNVQVKALSQLTSALLQERIAARSGQSPLPGYTNTMPSPERIVTASRSALALFDTLAAARQSDPQSFGDVAFQTAITALAASLQAIGSQDTLATEAPSTNPLISQ